MLGHAGRAHRASPAQLGRRAGVRRLRPRLRRRAERAQPLTLATPAARAAAIERAAAPSRGASPPGACPSATASSCVERDLQRLYRQGRKRHRLVLRGKGEQVHAMHEWRKRVKDLRYASEMLERPRRSQQGRRRADERTARAVSAPTRSVNCSARTTTSRCSPSACAPDVEPLARTPGTLGERPARRC